MRALLPIYQAITTVHLGDGRSTSFWHDVWDGDDSMADRFPSLFIHCKKHHHSVEEIVRDGLERHLVVRLTREAQAELQSINTTIRATALSTAHDVRSSQFAQPDGKLHTASLYRMLNASDYERSPNAEFIWCNHAPPRVRFFAWLLTNNKVQSRANLRRKTVITDDTCELCSGCSETAAHIIFHCPVASSFWRTMGFHIHADQSTQELHCIPRPAHVPAEHYETLMLLCCWMLWKRRNEKVFRGTDTSREQLLALCRDEARLWGCRLPQATKSVSNAWCLLFSNAM
ncbi:unnamed protein product [Urochloa humidicola]